MRLTVVLFAGVVAGICAGASADVISLVASRDNTMYQTADGSLSNGAGPTMFVGRNNSNSSRRGLVRFDLSGIPAGSTVTSAMLRMNMSQGGSGSALISLHRALGDWGEGASDAGSPGGGGAASAPGDATWIHRFYDTTQWTTPGGDFAVDPTASLNVGAVGLYTWFSEDLGRNVQDWLDMPATNFGWAMLGPEGTNGTARRFDTRENPVEGNRPTLIVEYTVPAPAGASLIVLGLGAATRRGRRR
ncbi:MAG: DNRLRE domain-containing protein [Phycisphaerales bacterium]